MVSSHKPATREVILDAAWRLFERAGGAEVRLEDVAKAAKVSRQAVYLHFASRGTLIANLITHIHERLGVEARLAPMLAAETGEGMLEAYVRFSAEYTPLVFPFAKALDLARRTDPAAEAAWAGRMQSRLERARAIVRRLAAEGRLSPELDVAEATDLLWTLCSLGTWEQLVLERRWSRRRYAEGLLRTVRAALLAPADAPRPARGR